MKKKRNHLSYQNRCRRLAQHLTWYGIGFPNEEDDYKGGVVFPRHIVTDQQATDVSRWAVATPNRWWCRVTIFCETETGDRYEEVRQEELSQAVLANDVTDWRVALVKAAKDRCNPKHIVLEKWETGVIA